VKHLAAVGTPQEQIARKIQIRSEKTLRKYFRDELDFGAMEANANVGGALYKNAMAGNVDAGRNMKTRRPHELRDPRMPSVQPHGGDLLSPLAKRAIAL
jgi:hypothetical protein